MFFFSALGEKTIVGVHNYFNDEEKNFVLFDVSWRLKSSTAEFWETVYLSKEVSRSVSRRSDNPF